MEVHDLERETIGSRVIYTKLKEEKKHLEEYGLKSDKGYLKESHFMHMHMGDSLPVIKTPYRNPKTVINTTIYHNVELIK